MKNPIRVITETSPSCLSHDPITSSTVLLNDQTYFYTYTIDHHNLFCSEAEIILN